jgi:uncharacterized protein
MKTDVQTQRSAAKPRTAAEIAFYRQCRAWHGYLSAFAFMTLIFFSVTGILLNHPDLVARDSVDTVVQSVQLSPAELGTALKAGNPGQTLAGIVQQKILLRGAYSSADIDSRQALLRFEGIKGNSDVTIDLKNGTALVSVQNSDVAAMLNDLHRGKNAGSAWRALIDIVGALILVLSIVGYVLFFSLSFRLRTSLALTGVSLVLLIGIFVLFVP